MWSRRGVGEVKGRGLTPTRNLHDIPPVRPSSTRTGPHVVIAVLKRLFQAIYGVGLTEFLLKIGWKGALAVVLILGLVVGIVLFGIAMIIAMLL